MAVVVVNSAETGSASATTLTITAATAGNLLVCFAVNGGSITTITGSDNVSGSTGWTTNATKATYGLGGSSSLWVAYKVAVGGETSLNPTFGGGGIGQGIACFELSGVATSSFVDTIIATNSNTSTGFTTLTSNSVTTTSANSAILSCAGGSSASGTVSAWTSTGPMANIATASTHAIGGSYIPTGTVSGATFTANWTSSVVNCMLTIAFVAAASGVPAPVNFVKPQTIMVMR